MEIPPNVWHTVLAKQENSILLEVKEGLVDVYQVVQIDVQSEARDGVLEHSQTR